MLRSPSTRKSKLQPYGGSNHILLLQTATKELVLVVVHTTFCMSVVQARTDLRSNLKLVQPLSQTNADDVLTIGANAIALNSGTINELSLDHFILESGTNSDDSTDEFIRLEGAQGGFLNQEGNTASTITNSAAIGTAAGIDYCDCINKLKVRLL